MPSASPRRSRPSCAPCPGWRSGRLPAQPSPPIWCCGSSGSNSLPRSPVTEEEIKLMIEQGTQDGAVRTDRAGDGRARVPPGRPSVSALMTPRPDVIWLDPNEPSEEIQRKITTNSHTHYPVAEGQIDNIIGMVNSKDLLSQNLSCLPDRSAARCCGRPCSSRRACRPWTCWSGSRRSARTSPS